MDSEDKGFVSVRNFCIAVGLAILFFQACTPKRVIVPIETVRTEYRDRIRRDTVIRRDSVHIFSKGDTVFVDRVKVREKIVLSCDTVLKVDTIARVVTVDRPTPYVPKIISIFATIGGGFILLCFVLLILKIRRIFSI